MDNLKSMTDLELMKQAKKRIVIKKSFQWHLAAYVLNNTFLVAIYFATSSNYFWPIWPILGWGLGVAIHGIIVSYMLSDIYRSNISNEYNRLKQTASLENSSKA